MQAEIIAIGDELTSGQRLDTNSQWLSHQLQDLGYQVRLHLTVADDLEAIEEAFRRVFQTADAVVCTGGLGPTADDLTRAGLAAAMGTELVLDEQQLAHIEQMFARRNREMPPRNRVQAMFPIGTRPIPNPHGTAPGIQLRLARGDSEACHLFALPGVPAEMREMWHESVQPALADELGVERRTIRHHCLKCFGIGESDLEQRLPDLIRRGREPSVGITVSRATITLRVSARGSSELHCRESMQATLDTIHECLGNLVFGEEEDELQHAVVRILGEQGRTLATAETGSGGLLADWISEADPQQTVYRGGWVLRGPEALATFEIASEEGVEQVVALAQDVRQRFACDYALALGAFPVDSASPSQVPYAIAHADGVSRGLAPYSGHPDILKARCVKTSLNALRLALLRSE